MEGRPHTIGGVNLDKQHLHMRNYTKLSSTERDTGLLTEGLPQTTQGGLA